MAYLERGPQSGACFLCLAHADAGTSPDLVVWRGRSVFALLNAYPYANGHVMVAPYAHEADLDAVAEPVAVELMSAVRLAIGALRIAYDPEGFNVGANLGSAAGAGLGAHLHLHVVPRWSGDTNFMTSTGNTRVLPEALDDTARRLRAAIERESEPRSEEPS